VVWPGPGADTLVQGVRCKVRAARPDDRAGLGSTVTSAKPSGGRARSKTGPRILSRTPTWPLGPSAKRRRRTPWRITVGSVISAVRPIIGAARSVGGSHQPGRDASSRAARLDVARPTRVRTAVGGAEGCCRSPRASRSEPGAALRMASVQMRRPVVVENIAIEIPKNRLMVGTPPMLLPQPAAFPTSLGSGCPESAACG
jgi:hypothetical protein